MFTYQVEAILKDAENLYEEALEELKVGKIRKAAENAWGATTKATDALFLARAKIEITNGVGRTREIYKLTIMDKEVKALNLAKRYNERRIHLHGDCFYEGIHEIPGVDSEELIRETEKYIEDIQKLSLGRE